jgi:hypothetical protein
MMQWEARQGSALGVKLEGSPTAYAYHNYMLARLEKSASMQTGAGKVNVGHIRVQA